MHSFGFGGFFAGRNGFDLLSGVILGGAVVCSIFYRIWPSAFWLMLLGIVLVAWAFFRIMSTKVVLRRAENERFLSFWQKLSRPGPHRAPKPADGYCYFSCPACGQRVRVPRGKGRIAITCPSCKAAFIETT